MKFIVEKALSSSTLRKTITMVNSTRFKYFNNLVTAMQSKAINPCNFVAGYNPIMNAR
jgi:hypothetical protein